MIAFALAAQAVLPVALPEPAAENICDASAERSTPELGGSRLITARDLATLTDIGRSDPYDSPSPFGVSPDGQKIAFVTRRADPDRNGFCQRLMVMPLDGKASPRERDSGGSFVRATFVLRNFPAVAAGFGKVITPKWSPDGQWIAFLKRVETATQAWIVASRSTAPARQVSALADDVEDLAWSPDGASLIVATRPELRLQMAAIAAEGRQGYLFDDRFAPQFADHPLPTAPAPLRYTQIDLATGATREATAADQTVLVTPDPAAQPEGARLYTPGTGRTAAWLESKAPGRLIAPTRIVLRRPDRRILRCAMPTCEGAQHLWWREDGRVLYILQRTGWGNSQTALLRWPIAAAQPKRVFVTDDALVGCKLVSRQLVCARESARHPRVLAAIDADTGKSRIIHDPNPQWAQMRVGAVRRFKFRNAYGVECYADLVLPPFHKPGEQHPLVVVQYVSDGFLRGGTGDEVPIQALTARGFAVLSFARPDLVESVAQARAELDLLQKNRDNWLDRRSVQSALEQAIALAVGTGAVDRARMGISGFSDGTSTTQWALLNSALFKVAAMGACCEDMVAYPLMGGPAFEDFGRKFGYRFFEPDAAQFWKQMSLAANAASVNAPLLIQTGDSEYEIGLDVVAAFRRLGKPIELRVFPGEPHFKWQPVHRLAMYERNLDWFSYWLMHKMDCSPAKAAQYARWQIMAGAPPRSQLACLSDQVSAP
nr:Atxe2 family lasso peptide isopeptidase [Novosphingobium hassiacum]